MKVRTLIKLLSKVDEDCEVLVAGIDMNDGPYLKIKRAWVGRNRQGLWINQKDWPKFKKENNLDMDHMKSEVKFYIPAICLEPEDDS